MLSATTLKVAVAIPSAPTVKLPVVDSDISLPSILPSIVYPTVVFSATPCVVNLTVKFPPSLTLVIAFPPESSAVKI